MKKDKYYWQAEAVDATFKFCKAHPDKNGLIVAPVGCGKSHVIAQVAKKITDAGGRFICITDSFKLVDQNAKRIEEYTGKKCGVYSSTLKRRDTKQKCISASIQSIHSALKKDINALGTFSIIMVDECHMINLKDEGIYREVLKKMTDGIKRKPRIIGLTATNYRLGQGYITTGYKALFHSVIYRYTESQALADGLWCPPVAPGMSEIFDKSVLKKTGGDFTRASLKKYAGNKEITAKAVRDALANSSNRKCTMWFASSVEQSVWIKEILGDMGIECGIVVGDTKISNKKQIADALDRFQDGRLNHLVNCQMLVKGYDNPRIDCGVLFFATASAAKFMQTCGRMLRLCPGKTDALILDYGGNFERHGPLNKIQIQDRLYDKPKGDSKYMPLKTCPNCQAGNIPLSARVCPFETCGYEFPGSTVRTVKADTVAPVEFDMGGVNARIFPVENVYFKRKSKKRVGFHKYVDVKIPSVEVVYRSGGIEIVEWVHYDGYGKPQDEARSWHSIFSDEPYSRGVEKHLSNFKQYRWPNVVYAYKSKGKWFPCAYGIGGEIVYKPGFFGGEMKEEKHCSTGTLFDMSKFEVTNDER